MTPLARRVQQLEAARRRVVQFIHPVFIAPFGCPRVEFDAFAERCRAKVPPEQVIFVLPSNGREER